MIILRDGGIMSREWLEMIFKMNFWKSFIRTSMIIRIKKELEFYPDIDLKEFF